ncbi:hypothetical protein JRQ81_005826 [Phrynocephalus forsythii]|uniref:CR021 protein n=1 Tax=Phrynocephalus forsythii TaxID=171643 RepID=A0A9Q1AVY9_9SAUR|nr:hypothetical protein JRQ81_005826 [Phrynocephalus forsythii]
MEQRSEGAKEAAPLLGKDTGKRQFLEAAAHQLVDTCPAEARFLGWIRSSTEDKTTDSVSQVCSYCFQIFLPGNYRVRLKPKMKLTPQVEKLLKKERKNYKLNLKQTKLLKRYKASTNVLLITCSVCGKTARHNGKSREHFGMKTPNMTPSSNRTTPASRSHSGLKTVMSSFSPRTSTSRLSTPRSSPRTPRNAKSHFTQLKKLLRLEEDRKNDKGDLKNFLLSL